MRVEPWWSCAAGDVVTAGVDEAGRGPLAGPVVAAAVVLNPARQLRGLRDSKLLSAAQREILNERIGLHALAVGVGLASVEEIDALNILQATMLAMQRAVLALSLTPHRVLVDGNRLPVLSMACEAIVGGDAKVRAISAASIVAKVHRDRLCADLHRRFPDYGFDVHKGYPTPSHLQALRKHGPCDVHRRSFAPVRAASMSTGWRSSTVGATVQPASTSCAKPAASAPDTGW